jgi:hypothetical protein
MRFLLLLVAWATLAFIPSWFASHPYQLALAGLAGRLAMPAGQIEFVELEIFYPYDLGIYVALCLASTWVTWKVRLRAVAIGLPILVVIELLSLLVAMKAILAVMTNPHLSAATADDAYRLATGIIRVCGLIAAASVWLYLLGRDRLPLPSKPWPGA